MTLAAIQSAMGAVGFLGDSAAAVPSGLQTDSRLLQEGELFLCISGDRFDGHTFAKDAIAKGAVAIVAERPPFSFEEMAEMECQEGGVPLLMVQDTVAALGKLAAYHRAQASATVVGVTGTAGKTTVKEVLAQVLSVRGETAKNYLNLNNQIGLPQSMLAASGDESFWVMEAGISEAQDMDELGAILHPDLAIVINAGLGHTQGLGDKGVAHYKARFVAYVADGGLGLVSADYPDLVEEVKSHRQDVRYFTTDVAHSKCVYRAEYLGGESATQGRYQVYLDGKEFELVTPFRGEYAAENVIAIAAAADLLGLSSKEIIKGFAEAKLPEKRANMREYGSWQLIDDCYNANPLSAHRMVASARDVAEQERLVFVMGEMLELGDEAHTAHVALGQEIGKAEPEAVFWVGGEFDSICQGLHEAGWQGKAEHIEVPRDFQNRVAPMIADGKKGTVLFKGSRGNRMERFVEVFTAEAQEASNAV